MKNKCKIEVESVTCSDHEKVTLIYSAEVPPARLNLPIPFNKFRRYFTKGKVDWSKFPCNIDTEGEISCPQEYYDTIVSDIKKGCDQNNITNKNKPFKKNIYRFSFQKDTFEAKTSMQIARAAHLRYTEKIENEDLNDSYHLGILETKHELYKVARNRFHVLARRN